MAPAQFRRTGVQLPQGRGRAMQRWREPQGCGSRRWVSGPLLLRRGGWPGARCPSEGPSWS
ncbi:hypothetical protein BDW27_1011 [Nocardiopsis sp. L17-MgMaSL7]|nr:hypothetical protein BDW27_1011 [Nocardiopsis sp. L17-MgMaSL7]